MSPRIPNFVAQLPLSHLHEAHTKTEKAVNGTMEKARPIRTAIDEPKSPKLAKSPKQAKLITNQTNREQATRSHEPTALIALQLAHEHSIKGTGMR